MGARVATYAHAGAAAVSILTEPSRFDGSLDDLAAGAPRAGAARRARHAQGFPGRLLPGARRPGRRRRRRARHPAHAAARGSRAAHRRGARARHVRVARSLRRARHRAGARAGGRAPWHIASCCWSASIRATSPHSRWCPAGSMRWPHRCPRTCAASPRAAWPRPQDAARVALPAMTWHWWAARSCRPRIRRRSPRAMLAEGRAAARARPRPARSAA